MPFNNGKNGNSDWGANIFGLKGEGYPDKVTTPIRSPNTVWKFHDFCITQIFREINFVDSRSAKTAIFAILWAVNFVH